MDAQVVSEILIVFLGSILQAMAGFGFTLFANPMLLMVGLTLPETVFITCLSSAVQKVLAVHHMRHQVYWREIWPVIVVSVLAIPLGTLALKGLSKQSVSFVKQFIGVLILLAIVLQIVWHTKPHERTPRYWGLSAGLASGFLSGLANIGGPPIVLWIHAHRWTNERIRVTVPAITLPGVPIQGPCCCWPSTAASCPRGRPASAPPWPW